MTTSSRLRLVSSLISCLTCCAASAAAQPSARPSFDCSKASSAREHAVCSISTLAAQDAQVAAAYSALRAKLSVPSSEAIRGDQRQWLHWLDLVCPAQGTVANGAANMNDCLQREYADRLKQLQPLPARPGAPVIYLRTEFDYVAASAAEKAASNGSSPGFGTGTFAWPQIDNPTPPQEAWNRALFATILAGSADPAHPKATASLSSGVDAEDTLWLSSTILSANEHVIVATVVTSIYGYGAAHPNTDAMYFTWLLQPGRELQAGDIFQPNSSYATALIPVVIAKLQPAPDPSSGFPDADTLRKSVTAELNNPRSWEPTRSGLIINFGQYEVGPYSNGMPQAEIPWSTLKPYLIPSLDPTIFPSLAASPR